MRTLWLFAGLLLMGAHAQTKAEELYLADDGSNCFYNMPMPESRSLKIERNFTKGEKYWLLVVSDIKPVVPLMATVQNSDGKVVARASEAEPATLVEFVPEQSGTYTIQCTTDTQKSGFPVLVIVYTPEKKSPKNFEDLIKFFGDVADFRSEVTKAMEQAGFSSSLHSQYASIIHRGKPYTWTIDIPAGTYAIDIFVDEKQSTVSAKVEGAEVNKSLPIQGGYSFTLSLEKPTRVRVTVDATIGASNAYAAVYVDAVGYKK